MYKVLRIFPVVFSLAAFMATGLRADEHAFTDTLFRCGSDFVSLGCTMHKVKVECGPPDSAQRVGDKKTLLTAGKGRTTKKKKAASGYLTEWIYRRDMGMYVLTFEGSRLIRKEFFKD